MNRRSYDVYLHEKLLVCVPRSGKSHDQIMAFARSLASDPFQKADYEITILADTPWA